MSARSKARKRALDVLFQSDLRRIDTTALLAAQVAQATPPVSNYTVTLVEGVVANSERIDELIVTYAEGWTLDRMPGVDRNVLRIGIFELLWCPEIPSTVAISEAVELASSLSTDDSPKFVNGMLARIRDLHPQRQP